MDNITIWYFALIYTIYKLIGCNIKRVAKWFMNVLTIHLLDLHSHSTDGLCLAKLVTESRVSHWYTMQLFQFLFSAFISPLYEVHLCGWCLMCNMDDNKFFNILFVQFFSLFILIPNEEKFDLILCKHAKEKNNISNIESASLVFDGSNIIIISCHCLTWTHIIAI